MRLRSLRIWKRGKPLWLFLIGWAIFGALLLLCLGYSIYDLRGGLPRVDVCASQTIDADDVRALSFQAEGVTLEVASAGDAHKITVQLYGEGYVNQHAVWNLDEDGLLTIRLDRYPVTANAYGARAEDTLTMRVLLPMRTYESLTVVGDRLHAGLYRCRSRNLDARVTYGSIKLDHTTLQRATLWGRTSAIDVERSRIQRLRIENETGDTRLFDNKLRYWSYTGGSGDLEALARSVAGIWELESDKGDIHVGVRRWNRNLLLDLESAQGTVTASSNKKPWRKTIPAALTRHGLQLMEGRGENMLLAESASGDITLDSVRLVH